MATEPLRAGVIGYPLKHSVSPQFQQPAFDHLGLNVTYRAYETPPEDAPAFLSGLRRGGWLGCNVTIPHKLAAYEGVDELTPEARTIGAVNTVIVQEDRLIGHNTDAAGFMRALVDEAGYDPRDQEVVLLGAGGAAPAVVVGLVNAGAGRIWVANRNQDRARALVARLPGNLEVIPLTEDGLRDPLARATLLVNSTSVGMSGGPAPDGSPVPSSLLGPNLLVYDLVYNPARTPLLEAAATAGARTQEGLPMLIYQGAASFERWTGRPAPIEVMMDAGRKALAERMRHG